MDNIKTWLVEVAWKKMGPSLLKTGLAALVGLMAAHQGLLSGLGINYNDATHTITLNLDTLSTWLIVMGSGGLTALFTAIQHHTTAAVTGAPQDGSHARATDQLTGGSK